MVEYVEGFQPEGRAQALVDGEDAGDLGIKLVVCDSPEGVFPDIAVCPRYSTGVGNECGGVQLPAIRLASSGTDGLMKISRDPWYQAWPVVADIRERDILSCSYGEWGSALNVDQRSELPVIEQ